MRSRLAVYRNTGGEGFLLDVQAGLLSHLNTRMVVPLLPIGQAPTPARTLNPVLEVEGERVVMVTQFMAAVPVKALGEHVQSAEAHTFEITAALDCLFSGV
jgi:toxin CcdB